MHLKYLLVFLFATIASATSYETKPKTKRVHVDSHLDIIFSKALHGMEFNYSEDQDNVYITTSKEYAEKVGQTLQDTISSREGFQRNFMGKCVSQTPFDGRCLTFQELGVSNTVEGVLLMKKLFGDIFEEQCFNDEAFTTKEAQFVDGKLYSRHFLGKRCQTVKGFQMALLSAFIDRDVNDVRRAFVEESFILGAQNEDISDEGLVGLMRNSVRLINTSHDDVCLVIDFQRMLELSFPPSIERELVEDGICFTISKKHVVLYLKQILLGDTLLRYVKTSEGLFAEPLFLTEKTSLAKPPYVVFVVDRSESLSGEIETLKEKLLEAVEQIWHMDRNAMIRMVFFATDREVSGVYDFSQRELLHKAIRDLTAGGSTRLLATLQDELMNVKSSELLKKYSVTFIAFTDGQDTDSKDVDLTTSMKGLVKKDGRFTTITLGFGKYCAKSTMAQIAKATLGQSFEFSEMHDFFKVLESSVDCENERKLERTLVKLHEEATTEAIISVPQKQFGVFPSEIYLSKEECGTQFQPVEEKITIAKGKQANQIKLSRAYFAARSLIVNKDLSISELERYARELREGRDDFSADLVDQFKEIITEYRGGRILKKDAESQLESKKFLFLI